MSFAAYVVTIVSKIANDPKKLTRIFEPRYWKHFYWMARFGTKSDLHESRWRFADDVAHRNYKSYEEYALHQSSKIEDRTFRKNLEALEDEQYRGFRRRFEVSSEITGRSTVLCLGARLGTEVRAFRDMGYFAVGVDLNPGIGNSYVLTGDFHNLAFGDGTVDVVYTNVLDHAFDLQKVMSETSRVLSPAGLALIEIVRGTEEGFLPQEYEAIAWKTARGFAEKLAELSGLKLVAFRTNTEMDDLYWNQAVLAKI